MIVQSRYNENPAFNGNCERYESACEVMMREIRCYEPLLPAGTSTSTTKLLWLCPSGIRDQECPVVCHKLLLQLHGAVGVDVFCVIRNQRLRDRLTDSVHLGCVSTTFYSDADINDPESVFPCNKNWLVDLKAEDFWLEKVDGGTIDMDEATTLLCVGDRSCSLPSRCKL